jgi:hypothetical protein
VLYQLSNGVQEQATTVKIHTGKGGRREENGVRDRKEERKKMGERTEVRPTSSNPLEKEQG